MRLPKMMVLDALEEAFQEVTWFVNQVDESNQINPKFPLGRVVELSGEYGTYASANPNYLNTTIQVDLWVANMREVDKYYFALDEVMRADNVQCTYTEETEDQDLKLGRRIIKRYTISQRVI